MKTSLPSFYRSTWRTSRALLLFVGMGFSPVWGFSYAGLSSATEWKTQQKITVSGSLVNAADQSPISGATILVDGKAIASTDPNGRFSIEVLAGKTVSFQSIGFQSHQQHWTANASQVRIALTAVDENIQEVIVTALGIKREEKSLGYAVSKVTGEQMTEATPATGWML